MQGLRILALASLAICVSAKKILPLGDSITFGCGDRCEHDCTKAPWKFWVTPCSKCSNGWRSFLWRSLKAANLLNDFEVVGSVVNNGDVDVPQHHEGHPGWTIQQVHNIKSTWLPFNADIILLHLGTNDMGIGLKSAKDSAMRMDLLLNDTFTALPSTHIFLASIIESISIYGGKKHAEYNAAIKTLVTKYNKMNFKITFVDMDAKTGLCNGTECCVDDVHPTIEGYKKMANVWFEALKSAYSSSYFI